MRSPGFIVKRILPLFSIVLLLVLLLGACSGGSSSDDDSGGNAALEDNRDRAESSSGGDDYADDDEAGGAEAPQSDGGEAGLAPIQTNYVANQVPLDRLIIRTVSISLTVEDVAQGSIWIRDLAARKNGFVFSSNTYVRDENEFAQTTIRVPAEQLDSTVQELREHDLVEQVDSEESTSQDVSQEYVDNESRLEALEETQRRFIALLAEADTVEDILRIESELTNIRSQIETIKGRQNYLDQMTSYSTVTITMHVEDGDLDDDEDDDGFIARIFGDAWTDASGFIEGLLAVVITLGIVGVAILPLAFIGYLFARMGYRRFVPTREPAPVNVGSNGPANE